MKGLRILRNAAVALATLGTMIPSAPVQAAGPGLASSANVKMVDAKLFDVALASGGTFGGRVVDHTGTAVEGAEVTIKQGDKEIARTVTNKQGTFAFAGMKNGVYTVTSGATAGNYRLWSENTAPSNAKPQGLLVLGENGTRGNFGVVDSGGVVILAIGAVAIAAIIVGAVALSNANRALNRAPASP